MATVFLPVTPLSRKIILSEHGAAEPVTPGRADWLSDALRIDRSDTGFSPAALAALSTGIVLSVPANLAERIARDSQRLGAVLHRLHIELLTRHMLSAAIMGQEAKAAMRAFYDLYRLDDDDLDEQSLYREYSRFRKSFFQKIDAKSATKSAGVVRPDSRFSQPSPAPAGRVSNAALDALCAAFDDRLRRCRLRWVKRLTRQAYIYIYMIRGQRKADQVATRFRLHRSGVYRALRSVRKRIREDQRFARAILPLLDESFVLPAPAPGGHLCAITASSTGLFQPGNPSSAHAVTPKDREPVAAAAKSV